MVKISKSLLHWPFCIFTVTFGLCLKKTLIMFFLLCMDVFCLWHYCNYFFSVAMTIILCGVVLSDKCQLCLILVNLTSISHNHAVRYWSEEGQYEALWSSGLWGPAICLCVTSVQQQMIRERQVSHRTSNPLTLLLSSRSPPNTKPLNHWLSFAAWLSLLDLFVLEENMWEREGVIAITTHVLWRKQSSIINSRRQTAVQAHQSLWYALRV